MTRRQYVLIVLLAFIGGFIGGSLPVKDFMVAAAGDSEKALKIPWENLPDKGPVEAEKKQKKIDKLDKLWNETHPDKKISPVEAKKEQKKKEAQKEWEATVKKWEETKGKEWRKGLKEIGRFQLLTQRSLIYIPDTKQGHVWVGPFELRYIGQVLPIKKEE